MSTTASVQPLRPLARWAQLGVGLYGVILLVAVAANLERLVVIDGFEKGTIGLSRAERSDDVMTALGWTQLVVSPFVFGMFVAWFHRAYRNAVRLGLGNPPLGTGWAVGAWFIPVGGLWPVKLIADATWDASGTAPAEGSRRDRLPTIWWGSTVAHVAAALVFGFAARATEGTYAGLREEATISILADVVAVASVVVSLVYIARLTGRQEERISGAPDPRDANASRRVTLAPLAVAAIGLAMGGAVIASSRGDDALAASAVAHPSDAAVTELDRACGAFNEGLDAIPAPKTVADIPAYFDAVIATYEQRDAAFAAAPVAAEAKADYEREFLGPVRADSAQFVAVIRQAIEAAKTGDGTSVQAILDALPETVGNLPGAVGYARQVGANTCQVTFSSPNEPVDA
ncbi:MAG TPA: DUF4328 domain-containing protein [Acidimicrobiales bacterium]